MSASPSEHLARRIEAIANEEPLTTDAYNEARYLMALQKCHAPLLAFAAKAST
jgi:hypothetical protein